MPDTTPAAAKRPDPGELTFRETLVRLRGYLGPNARGVALGCLLLMASAVIGLLQPLAARWVLEALGEERSLVGPLLALSGLVVVAAIALGFGTFALLRSAEAVVFYVGQLGSA